MKSYGGADEVVAHHVEHRDQRVPRPRDLAVCAEVGDGKGDEEPPSAEAGEESLSWETEAGTALEEERHCEGGVRVRSGEVDAGGGGEEVGAELIFVTNITNYIYGEKIVMWRNFGKYWENLGN